MSEIARRTPVIDGLSGKALPLAALLEAQVPAILKGVARDWPLVREGRGSADRAIDHLLSFYGGAPAVGYEGAPEIAGRFFYTEDVTALNFTAGRVRLDDWLARLRADPDGPALYVGSADLDATLPGLRAQNGFPRDAPMFGPSPPLASIWIGNRTTAAAHYDMSNNLACCLVGRRRFTLFPPEQVANLYPGPLDLTPGGQAVSMIDFNNPDFERHPRFREALAAAEVADLEPGDLLFYPALWWHQVEARDAFNVMTNYWWNPSPAFLDSPMTTLLHGLLSLRDRPAAEKSGWQALFDHYVFGPADRAGAHLPPAARGLLGPLDEIKARRLRADLLRRLNR